MKHAVKNSVWQTFNTLASTGINLLLILVLAWILAPADFGSLVTSQAKVLLWIFLVDLGLYNGFITILTKVEADRDAGGAAYGRFLLRRVWLVRLGGAVFASLLVFGFSRFQSTTPDQDLVFLPYLFAFACQQTITPYAIFLGMVPLCILANLAGILAAALAGIAMAKLGATIPWILFAQSGGGFLATAIIWWRVQKHWRETPEQPVPERFLNQSTLTTLLRDAWPFAVLYASAAIWQRLDQIVASHYLGFDSGAQYALVVRLAAVPVAVTTALTAALFPDLQRVGRDDPRKLVVYGMAVCRGVFVFGLPLIFVALFILAWVGPHIFPKFPTAFRLLLSFAPGIWALWLNIFIYGILFGLLRYKRAVACHLFALTVYGMTLVAGAKFWGLSGVVFGYNAYCLALTVAGLAQLRLIAPMGIRPNLLALPNAEERAFWSKFKIGRN